MISYKEKYKNQIITTIVIVIIGILLATFLILNIRIRDEKIWQLRVENEDLKEQICNRLENKE